MKFSLSLAGIVACLLAVSTPSGPLLGAPVTFHTPVTLTDEHDVLTTGLLDRAVSFGGTEQTVNGVVFQAGNASNGQTMVDFGATTLTASAESVVALGGSPTFSGDGDPANSLSKPYRALVASGAYNNTTKGTLTVTLSGLKAGTAYTVQFFINDSRDFHGGGRTAIIRSGSANSDPILFSNTGAAGGVGQYVTATFTADSTTQEFVIAPVRPEVDDAQINALQLRINDAAAKTSPTSAGQRPPTPTPRKSK